MKYIKNGTILLFLVGFSFTQAQTEKGKVLIGADSNMNMTITGNSIQSDEETVGYGEVTTIKFSPQVAYLVANNFALGIEVPYENSSADQESKAVLVLPFMRIYAKNKSSPSVKPFFQAGAGFGVRTIYTRDEDFKSDMFSYKFNTGVASFINQTVALEFGIQYQYNSLKLREFNPNNVKIISKEFSFNLGFSFVL